MTELLIKSVNDNKFHRAVLPDGFELSLTIENPYLTKSSEYSGEIELPLKGCKDNLVIFGHVNRLDVTRRKKVMDAMLIIDNKKIVVGSITILECNDVTIKVQLLGDNASVNFKTKYDKLFVDQMDLGNVFDKLNLSTSYQIESGQKTINVTDLDSFKKYLAAETAKFGRTSEIYGTPIDGFAILPAIDDEGEEVNRRCFIFWRTETSPNGQKYICRRAVIWPGIMANFKTNSNPPVADIGTIAHFYGAIKNGSTKYYKGVVCPQPFMVSVIHRIVNCLGYEIVKDDIESSPFAECYIPSTTETILVNEMLPHWTVNDFLSEVENFFGVLFLFDEDHKTCSIVNKKMYYKDVVSSHLKEVDDSFETSFDEENAVDISNANVSFGLDDSLHKLTDAIEKNATIIELDNYSVNDILQIINEENQSILGDDVNKVIVYRQGRHFIKYGTKAMECNELRDYKIDDADSEITLKIKPALLDYSKVSIIDGPINGNNEAYDEWSESYGYMTPKKWPAPICPKMGAWASTLNITEAIDYGYKETIKPDYLPLALIMMGDTIKFSIKNSYIGVDSNINSSITWGSTYGSADTSDMNLTENNVAIRLNPTEGMVTLFNKSIDVGVKIKGQTVTKINIYDKQVPPIDSFFVFNGKRYICQKIECKVKDNGIDPVKAGYFFEVE